MAAATTLSTPSAETRAARSSGFLSSSFNDFVFLIGSPLLAFGVFLPFSIFPVFDYSCADGQLGYSLEAGFIQVVIVAHLALALFVLLPVTFAIWTVGPQPWPELRASEPLMTAVVLVVSIMHFWYDGFIWSVRKGPVH